MKRKWIEKVAVLVLGLFLVATYSNAQLHEDKENTKEDTLKVGNFIIIREKGSHATKNESQDATIEYRSNRRFLNNIGNISTTWLIMDLGFANYRDQTDYTLANSGGFLKQFGHTATIDKNAMKLIPEKSSNVNIWAVMQKLNVYKHYFNLKYGLGLEMYNFRFRNSISYRKDAIPGITNGSYVFYDTISFSKNKLYTSYLTVPFMLNFNPLPDRRHVMCLSIGASVGYLLGSHTKQISSERGKQKFSDPFELSPWRTAIIGEIGIGPVRLYTSYSLNPLHRSSTSLEQYPYVVGARFSTW